jgi:hypothetical protein
MAFRGPMDRVVLKRARKGLQKRRTEQRTKTRQEKELHHSISCHCRICDSENLHLPPLIPTRLRKIRPLIACAHGTIPNNCHICRISAMTFSVKNQMQWKVDIDVSEMFSETMRRIKPSKCVCNRCLKIFRDHRINSWGEKVWDYDDCDTTIFEYHDGRMFISGGDGSRFDDSVFFFKDEENLAISRKRFNLRYGLPEHMSSQDLKELSICDCCVIRMMRLGELERHPDY